MDNHRSESAPQDEACQTHSLQAVETIAQCGSWHVDIERRETEWSHGAYEIFDITSADTSLTYGDVSEFVAHGYEETVEQKRESLFDGEPFEIEYQIEINGATKWIHERAEIQRNDEGAPIAAIGVLQDITSQKERVQSLERFRTLIDHSSDGVFIVDSETSAILDVNETACQLLGYTREELLSLSVPDINPAFSAEMWREFAATVRENGTEVIETEHQRDGGSTFPVEIHVSLVSLDRDYHVATVRDITERKEREKQLEATRKRYQTLIDAAPDPIFVADAETGEIVEANAAAAELRQQPRDEVIGLHQTALHPDDDMDQYRDLFEYHVEHSETIKEFDDGTPVYFTTVEGDRIPVAISTTTVSLGDRTLIHGIFRDISEERQYEDALAGINTAAQELLHAETDTEIAQIVVDVATEILDKTGTGVYLYDDHAEELTPAAYSEHLEDLLDEIPRFSPGDGIAWWVFAEQESARFDDVRTAEDVYNAGTPIRSELLIPLGEHGVFLVGDTDAGGFDDMTDELAETLAATAEAALDHAQQAQTLRKQERKAQSQAEQLERVNQLNDRIRTIMQALIQADSHEAITRHVCDSLVSLDGFAYVWIGEPDSTTNELRIAAEAGSPQNYLEAVSLEQAADNTLPAVRATRNRTSIIEPQIASNLQGTEWRNTALLHEFRSVISVPLLYDEFQYGVLTIYSNRSGEFNEHAQSVLTELGHLVGYALNATDQRNALLGSETVDVTFDLTNCTDLFVEFAAELSAEIQIENVIPRSDNAYLVHFVCEKTETESIWTVAEDFPPIIELQVISESDRTLYEAIVVGDCLVATLATIGANIQSSIISENRCQISASLSEERERQTFVERLKESYPDIDVSIRKHTTSSSEISGERLLDDSLTDRQQDVLRTAYYSGFFDQQRKRTGSEIATSLDVSQPGFATRLRAAQRNLFSGIFDQ